MDNDSLKQPSPFKVVPTIATDSPYKQNPYTSSEYKPESKLIWSACQNCGKPVQIMVPFVGCVFCEDCMKPSIYSQQADSEYFKIPYKGG
jgi:hypothetical protein